MNICFPVIEDKGLESPVSAHFGSAPLFLILDTDTGNTRPIPNRNAHHSHGMCQPLASLAGEHIDGMVVGGIGMGALMRLQAANVQVFLAEHATVQDAMTAFRAGHLREVTPATACGGHESGHHGHGPNGNCHGHQG